MSLIRGVLLAGRFRTHHELNGMSADDQRNTLIVEIANRTKQTNLQSFNDATLAGMGAVMVFLRESKIRNDQDLKQMTADDQRNTLIVEIDGQTRLGPQLQGMSNIDLVLLGLGANGPGSLTPGSFLRGVLLAGRFRNQRELNTMTADNQRNTLIFEIATRTKQTNLQSFDDFALAGMGALFVFLREGRMRDDAALKTMTSDDQRNTTIVELDGQTHLGAKLQGLGNMDLIRVALGAEPRFTKLPPPLQPPPQLPFVFRIGSFEARVQKSDGDHSDSDWLTIVVTISNPLTKASRTVSGQPQRLEGSIKTGDVINGSFSSPPIDATDADVVTISYVITNLGSSDAEEQFAQAVKVTDQVVQIVAPIAGVVIGSFFGQPEVGLQIAEQIAQGFDTAIDTLSDVFDFLDVHAGPPNCNGEVLHDTLVFQPGELVAALHQPASRDYTGTQAEERCGGAPESVLHFGVERMTEAEMAVVHA